VLRQKLAQDWNWSKKENKVCCDCIYENNDYDDDDDWGNITKPLNLIFEQLVPLPRTPSAATILSEFLDISSLK
jgi:hypothetical protein